MGVPHPGRRGLTTARAVLQVLGYLEAHPDGVRADDVAQVVGKSGSTAYYLLASLVDEGFATHEGGLYLPRAHGPARSPADEHAHGLTDPVDDLFLRTHKRCYLGVVRTGAIEIAVVRGRQGIAKMPGLGTQIRGNAHALAMGKVVLSRLRPDALARYAERGLQRYTRSTITTLEGLESELERVREHGFAVDREEFDKDFCCIAAPVLDDRGRLAAVLGLSASTRAFDAEHDQLSEAVREVATETVAPRFQHRAETHEFLAAVRNGGIRSGRSRGTQSEVTT
jgi:DNA-binding IclR family transcriptional regulator